MEIYDKPKVMRAVQVVSAQEGMTDNMGRVGRDGERELTTCQQGNGG